MAMLSKAHRTTAPLSSGTRLAGLAAERANGLGHVAGGAELGGVGIDERPQRRRGGAEAG